MEQEPADHVSRRRIRMFKVSILNILNHNQQGRFYQQVK
jgi:hypothetical protein